MIYVEKIVATKNKVKVPMKTLQKLEINLAYKNVKKVILYFSVAFFINFGNYFMFLFICSSVLFFLIN
jgi:hypothetical protein